MPSLDYGLVEVLRIPGCGYKVVVVRSGDVYVVGDTLSDWFMVPAGVLRRLLAKLLGVDEEEMELKC